MNERLHSSPGWLGREVWQSVTPALYTNMMDQLDLPLYHRLLGATGASNLPELTALDASLIRNIAQEPMP